MIKWNCNRNESKPKAPPVWKEQITRQVHDKPAAGIKASRSGKIAVMMSDGHLSLIDAGSLKPTSVMRKPHEMPITAAVFREEEGQIITSGLDYKYCVLPVNPQSMFEFVRDLLLNMAILLIILLYVADWIV